MFTSWYRVASGHYAYYTSTNNMCCCKVELRDPVLIAQQEDARSTSSAETAVNRDDDDVSDTTMHGESQPPVKKHYLINVGHGVYQRAEEADVTSNLSPPDESFERPQHRVQVRGVSGFAMCHGGSVLACAAMVKWLKR